MLSIALALSAAACAPASGLIGRDARLAHQAERAGLAYARDNCASCHAVEGGATDSPVSLAPAFQTVADTPGMTAIALRVWLRTPHQAMPDYIVPDRAIDDLAVYLATLKTHGQHSVMD